MTPFRIGFIGAGGISGAHMKDLKPIPGVELVAAADPVEANLQKAKDNYGVAAHYTDYKKMLKDSSLNLDAVSVCTPNFLHAQPTIDALEAGKHVIVEKPMAMTVKECQKMVAAAKANKRHLVCGFQWRFDPKAQYLANIHKQGGFGDIQYVRIQALRRRGVPSWGVFYDKAKQGGGPLIDIGVHVLEMTHYIIGKPQPVTVSASMWTDIGQKKPTARPPWGDWNWKDLTVEDLAVGMIRFANGVTAVIESSFCAHIEKDVWTVQIMGSKGGGTFEPLQYFTDQHGYMVNSTPSFIGKEAHFAEKMKHFVAVCRGERENDSSGEDGLAVQQILCGLYDSAEAGKEIKVGK